VFGQPLPERSGPANGASQGRIIHSQMAICQGKICSKTKSKRPGRSHSDSFPNHSLLRPLTSRSSFLSLAETNLLPDGQRAQRDTVYGVEAPSCCCGFEQTTGDGGILLGKSKFGRFELPPFRRKDHALQVVIETPKASRNKYSFDERLGLFVLKKVLPAGMAFPYDFGFAPSTVAEDGDPTDVLVLMDEPAFTGCLLRCRIVGIIEGVQGKKKMRNDRVVAIQEDAHSFADIKHISDLGKKFVKELEEFFVDYHKLSGEQYRVLDARGPKEAMRRIQDGIKAYRKT
jgi:inorganic pyrophosphatase